MDDLSSVKRKDSGLSGLSTSLPEAAAPKARDFAHEARHEKHDTTTTMANKENLWQRMRALVPLKFGV